MRHPMKTPDMPGRWLTEKLVDMRQAFAYLIAREHAEIDSRASALPHPPGHVLDERGNARFIAGFALPQRQHRPAGRLEFADLTGIALHVRFKLGPPEIQPALRHPRVLATRMSMPEATVHEDGQLGAPEHDVRLARQFPRLQAVS